MSEKLSVLINEAFKTDELKSRKKIKREYRIFNLNKAETEINNLIENKSTFEVKETKNSIKIKVIKENYIYNYHFMENKKSMYFLIMLNKLKKEIRDNNLFVLNSTYSPDIKNISYFEFSSTINDFNDDAGSCYEFNNVYECDISHAYYRAAYVMGFISEKLYKEIINKMSKADRLKLLGAIATIKIVRNYENGELVNKPQIVSDDLLRMAWFKICNYIDSCLLEFKGILKNNFLFYWVDGIYFNFPYSIDLFNSITWGKIRELMIKYNIDLKTIQIPKMTIENKLNYVELNVYKPDGEVKRFFPDKKQIKGYSIMTLNQFNNYYKSI